MLLFRRLLRVLRGWLPRARGPNFTLDVETIDSLHSLAEQECRSPEDLANQLLNEALHSYQAQDFYWSRWQHLSPREQEVTALICLNYTTRQIASKLHISPETVKTHAEHALMKFGIPDRNMLRTVLSSWDFQAWDR